MLNIKKFICVFISCSILFSACAAHVAQIEKPTNTEKADWLAYYEDQFKAYGEKVEAPEGDVPEVQMRAYIEAKDSFQSAQQVSTILGWVALGIGLSSLIVTLGQL